MPKRVCVRLRVGTLRSLSTSPTRLLSSLRVEAGDVGEDGETRGGVGEDERGVGLFGGQRRGGRLGRRRRAASSVSSSAVGAAGAGIGRRERPHAGVVAVAGGREVRDEREKNERCDDEGDAASHGDETVALALRDRPAWQKATPASWGVLDSFSYLWLAASHSPWRRNRSPRSRVAFLRGMGELVGVGCWGRDGARRSPVNDPRMG